jgi:hypothetical protein
VIAAVARLLGWGVAGLAVVGAEELRRRSRLNAAAVAADRAPDFSRRIREGLPSQGRLLAAGP